MKKYLLNNVETNVLPFTALPHDGVAFDVGSCVGIYIHHFLQHLGPKGMVYAFEPEPKNFIYLQDYFGDKPNVTLIQAALSDYNGKGVLFTHPSAFTRKGEDWEVTGNVANHFLIGSDHDQPITCLKPPYYPTMTDVYSIDNFVQLHEISRVDLIKIDTEGSEIPVLKGALETLKRFMPRLIIEIHYDNEGQIRKMMDDIGYGVKTYFPKISTNPGIVFDKKLG